MQLSRMSFYLFLSAVLVLSGCSLTPGQGGAAPAAATEVKDMLTEGPGTHAGDKYSQSQVEEALKELPEDLSTDTAYNELIRLLAEDYRPIEKKIDEFDPSIQVKTAKPGDVSEPENQTQLNVEILLDASGSMAEPVEGKTRMALAKQSIKKFSSSLPSNVQVGLRVYGHKGSNSKKDKKASCESNELVYPLKRYNETAFQEALDRFKPTGWTPLAAAIEEAGKDLEGQTSEGTQNVVYVVSDGMETCGGDPVAAARSLNQSNIEAVVNIIGFDVDDEGQEALKKAAAAGGGSYDSVTSEQDLSQYFSSEYQVLKEKWAKWRKTSESRVDSRDTVNQNKLHKLTHKDAIGKVEKEYDRLLNAAKALKTHGKIEDNYALMQKVNERKNKLKGHFIDRKNKIDVMVQEEQKKRLEEIKDTEQKEQEKIDQQLKDIN